MFHSVRKSGRPIEDSTSITEEYFHAVMAHARELGYETITSEELIGFLTTNLKIPEKSMYMVLDDRRPGVTERFIPYLDYNDWTLTLGWIIEDQREYLWDQMEGLVATSGRLDVQSHGYWHRYIVEETPEDIIREEIFNPIPIIEEHFGTKPIIFIWPGGNFTELSVELAHEAGYEVAFTAYARGPLMFNWVPQAAEEKIVGDPLMTLPRFWSVTAWTDLDETIEVGQEALAHALQQYPDEAAWYQANCGGELPPPPENTLTDTE
jgi:peptidoglycan/xylan/chitin deacetylase (PgdA/CDA1 family)